MANIEKVVKFELTPDEKCWLSFANLAIAEITEQLSNEDMDFLMNSQTGEIIDESDLKKAFAVIDYLLDGNLEVKY